MVSHSVTSYQNGILLRARIDIPDEGILCFDDRNQAPADIQKVLANILQARTLHGVPLKKGWHCISTGNRQSDRAGANRILSHLRNRETVIELETHLDDWTSWAIENDVKPELISFIRFRPNLLHDFDPQRDINPTPRSWVEGVSDVIGIVPADASMNASRVQLVKVHLLSSLASLRYIVSYLTQTAY